MLNILEHVIKFNILDTILYNIILTSCYITSKTFITHFCMPYDSLI